MKTILAFCIATLGFTSLFAQDSSPKFPYNLGDWLSKQVIYPEEAAEKKIRGVVYVSFIVEKDGSVSNIKVVKGIKNGAMLNKEAERIVSIMPKWTPGFQDNKPTRTELTINIIFTLKGDSIPQFPGEISSWLTDSLKYPKEAKYNSVQGTVYIGFTVEKDGSVDSVKLLKGVEESVDDEARFSNSILYKRRRGMEELNQEALRVVYKMPKWKPGKMNGQPVSTKYSLPIRFVLH